MSSEKLRDKEVTKKILNEIYEIEQFIESMSEDEFYQDRKTQKATVMSLINIGELVKVYTDEFLQKHKDIPWKKIQALRNIAAHKYESIDSAIVWDTITISVPDFKKALEEYKSEVMEAMEEAKYISKSESVKGYYDIDEAFEELEK